jgi:BirA family transcriptional regulator, biotin operon repressor / biotin---[acetyl-CoA-carboxylase] ligase
MYAFLSQHIIILTNNLTIVVEFDYFCQSNFEVKLFSLENFDIRLNTDFIGRNFVYTEEIDSTNSFLLDKANKFSTDGTVLLAEKQNKGHGRNNKVWYSTRGYNLTFSILLTNKKYLGKSLNILNFAASLAVSNALENIYQLKTELKWPNDVLVNGKKIAGILMESVSHGSKVERLVIGIGINVNQILFQGNYNITPTSIKLELNETIERERVMAEYLNNFEETLNKFEASPPDVIKDWKARCGLLGEKISITEGDKTRYGVFDDIDEEGFLLLKNKGRIEKIYFGDVNI